jgi:hypothetical protein
MDSNPIIYNESSFNSTVWRVDLDSQNRNFLIEIRNKQFRQVSFFQLSAKTAKQKEIKADLPSDWWIGMIGQLEGIALFHGYEEAGLPIHKGLWAYDMEEMKTIWSRPDEGAVYLENGQIISENNYAIGLRSGETLPMEKDNMGSLQAAELHFPLHYEEDDTEFKYWFDFVEEKLNKKIGNRVSVMEEQERFWLYSYLAEKKKQYMGALFLFDKKSGSLSIEYQEELEKMIYQPFFRSVDMLVCMPSPEKLRWYWLS